VQAGRGSRPAGTASLLAGGGGTRLHPLSENRESNLCVHATRLAIVIVNVKIFASVGNVQQRRYWAILAEIVSVKAHRSPGEPPMRGQAVVQMHPPARVSARNARTRTLHKHTRTSPAMGEQPAT
jgi:hypothetical protein